MKKCIFLFTALFAAVQLSAQSIDTVKVINQPNQVIITETPSNVQMRVIGSENDNNDDYVYTVEQSRDDSNSDWELNFPFNLTLKKKSGSHWALITSGFYMGGGIHHSWEMINNSFEIGLLNIAAINYDSHHGQDISLGVGIHHKSFSLKRPNMLVHDEATEVVSTMFYPDGVKSEDRTSNLNMWALQFPLMFGQKIYKSFGIKFGAIMNWNYKAQVNNHFYIDHSEYDITQRGLKQNKITFDLMGGLSSGSIGIYCRYSPNDVFKKGYGPEIKNTWTLGGTIAF